MSTKNKISFAIGSVVIGLIVLSCCLIIFNQININNYKKKTETRVLKLDVELNNLTKERDSLLVYKKKADNLKQNLMDSFTYLNPNVDPLIKEQIVNSLISECSKVNLPPLLVLCIIKQESNFNPLVKNGIDATGLMQIIPKYHQDKIEAHGWKPHEIFFIKNNILLGTEILKQYFIEEDNNMVKGLQKYVGAIVKSNASKYIENIINDYVSLEVMFFMDNRVIEETEEVVN